MLAPSRFVLYRVAALGIVLCGCASSPKERVVVVPEGKASQQDNSVREMLSPAKPTPTSTSASPAKEGTSVPSAGSTTQTSNRTETPQTPLQDDEVRSLMSARLVTEADLRGRTAEEVTFLKNEPFARRGYIFKTNMIQNHFAAKSWYQPSARTLPELRGIEAKNVTFIGKYQDTYGLHIRP